MNRPCRWAVIGAGPYGLSVAAHLRERGLDVRIFGKAMEFWDQQMPVGMKLRSPLEGSHISDPKRALTLHTYKAEQGAEIPMPFPVEDFIRYGQWFQRRALEDLDPRYVQRIERTGAGFQLTLEDGESVVAENVVIATGIGAFPTCPEVFAGMPRELVSHSSARENRDFRRLAGKRVVVIGGGQSAIESAALLHEAGAEVEVLVRDSQVRWLRWGTLMHDVLHSPRNPIRGVLFPPGNIGPPGINWLIEVPTYFKLLPRRWQEKVARHALRPAASGWLVPRTREVAIRPGTHVIAAKAEQNQIRLELSDQRALVADHVLLGTGYSVAIHRCAFLDSNLVERLAIENGHPVLNPGFESSVPGLFFVGAPAVHSFGPIVRFVAGTYYTARTLAKYAAKRPLSERKTSAEMPRPSPIAEAADILP